ncbi:hypothetical protein M407DRAFT_28432 [Tulasnella calospora MUT 4182]|uniref:Peptide hydrolase n=1 Tax=Tulasnella calospora MUT 4182 TaxID=1051891 RepID=A0A0C3LKX3_9AGAM|nr:hypothetical protein M407DRAFT_28432 [Tulasnella calospora MUT 4182]
MSSPSRRPHPSFKPPSTTAAFLILLSITFVFRFATLPSGAFDLPSLNDFSLFSPFTSSHTNPPQVDVSRILKHLRIFDRIVAYHGGNRHASGTGYETSAKYVEHFLGQDSCDVLERQQFDAPYWKQLKPATVSVVVGKPKTRHDIWDEAIIQLEEGRDFDLIHGPSAQWVSVSVAPLEGLGCKLVRKLMMNLPGYEVWDKVIVVERPSLEFMKGRGRGGGDDAAFGCSLNDVIHAGFTYGAKGLIITNGEQDGAGLWPLKGWQDVEWKDSGPERLPKYPVLSTSYAVGQILRNDGLISLDSSTSINVIKTFNLLCTWEPPSTTASNVTETLVIGAHLDSVATGPGVVDNASGSATILEWLLTLKKAGWWTKGGQGSTGERVLPEERRIVWAWWGAEELGLVGSQYFASNSVGPLNVVAAINVDMIASPNGVPRIVNASSAPIDAVIAPSQKIQKRFETEFRLVKESWERADSGMFNSDDWSFLEVGVPTGGLLNGASKLKTQSQREVYGGMAHAQYDPCWHRGCDTFGNVNVSLLKLMSRVGFNTVQYLAKKIDLKTWLWNGLNN